MGQCTFMHEIEECGHSAINALYTCLRFKAFYTKAILFHCMYGQRATQQDALMDTQMNGQTN